MNMIERAWIQRISSNNIRARQAQQDGSNSRELRALLAATEDINRLLTAWDEDPRDSEINDSTAMSYAESACHTAERIRELVAVRVERYFEPEGNLCR